MSSYDVYVKLREKAGSFPRLRLALLTTIETTTFAVAGILAFALRFDFNIPAVYVAALVYALAVWIPAKFAAFAFLGLHRRWWRYVSLPDLTRMLYANLLGASVSFVVLTLARHPVTRSVFVMDLFFSVVFTAAARVSVRLLVDTLKFGHPNKQRTRTIIYGAGSAGIALLREIRQNLALAYDVCGFVDDSDEKRGLSIHGVQVLGGGPDLGTLATRHALELVLIAIPSASGYQMTSILGHCHAAHLSYKTMPSLAELIEENGLARQMRDVAVEDLLGRSPVRLEQDRISGKLRNRTVLVTGAAGSIGSELCRQIARFQPAAIVAYDIAETPLFHLDGEMARIFPNVLFRPEIGSIQNAKRLSEVFGEYNPSIIYHAAAYKHVPLMEAHAFEAVENNVFGTLKVAMAAAEYEASDFVMISSDKAVHPTNLMGASKRLAELIIRSLQASRVKYVSVRFGNVLGSNGSVVPIFKDQIARGGPVTVTHPEMRRYFMTIPEASQLVLQSSTMGKGGEIFVLDMGEPVRILDLARNLILLSGFRPDHDIKIEFTGARPGEKMYEELQMLEEDTLPTYHEKIKVFSGTNVAWPVMADHLARLHEICADRDLNALLLILKDIVPEYTPSSELLCRALRKPAAPPVYFSLAKGA